MYTQEFINLVMGDRNTYPIPFDTNGTVSNPSDVQGVAKCLLNYGYTISNLPEMIGLLPSELLTFMDRFKPETKTGYILRKGFAKTKAFKEYSEDEWKVIFAQYALTYGWAEEYQQLFNDNANRVISTYNSKEVKTIQQIMMDSKIIKIGFRKDIVALIRDILQSSVVLRAHQKKTLEACPMDIFIDAYQKSKITIREILILAIIKIKESDTYVANVFKFPTDVLRFILAKFAHEPFEGQITKPDLKDRKVRIPTSYRKWLMKELNSMGNPQYICEDMFKYESYWKLMHQYLRYGKAKTARKRFPDYHAAIDLLYNGDRSWTFNGRYSAALVVGDYKTALDVARERPGFLLRNIMNFLRYPEGTAIAQTETGITSFSLDPTTTTTVPDRTVITDDISYFVSRDFIRLIEFANTKLAFQLLEQLKNPITYTNQTVRIVQGVTKQYSVPIPGIKKTLATKVIKSIRTGISTRLMKRNADAGKVYIDESLKDNLLQYSGRNSTELNYSGTFLTPGSMIDIPNTEILRVGVIWRGLHSDDLDHNVSLFSGFNKIVDVYWGRVSYESMVTSSGDITSCSERIFSAEFIDIDLKKVCKDKSITSMITSLISYTGKSIGNVECYLFIKGLSKTDRKIKSRTFNIDLMDTDYAVRIDVDNIEKSSCYIGFNILMEENKIQVCAYTPKDKTQWSTIEHKDFTPKFLEGVFGNGTTLYESLNMAFHSDQLVSTATDADLIFGPFGLDPTTDLEKINEYIL